MELPTDLSTDHPPAWPTDTTMAWYRRIPTWVGPVAVGTALAGACAYTLAVDPNTGGGFLPACYFRELTGLDCPGCGLTRAAHAMLLGDPLRAVSHNLLAAIVFPVMIYAYLAWTASTFGWRVPQLRIRPWMAWAFTALLGAFWVLRNLPGPFSWLGSTA